MHKVLDFFAGKKSYIVGALMVALGLLNGDNDMVLQGIAVVTLRAGIAKV